MDNLTIDHGSYGRLRGALFSLRSSPCEPSASGALEQTDAAHGQNDALRGTELASFTHLNNKQKDATAMASLILSECMFFRYQQLLRLPAWRDLQLNVSLPLRTITTLRSGSCEPSASGASALHDSLRSCALVFRTATKLIIKHNYLGFVTKPNLLRRRGCS
jgi:hypothetical protein